MDEGADPNERVAEDYPKISMSPLSWAAAKGDRNMATLLMDSGAYVDSGAELAADLNKHPEMKEFLKTYKKGK